MRQRNGIALGNSLLIDLCTTRGFPVGRIAFVTLGRVFKAKYSRLEGRARGA
jgi:hypothetical protein